MYHPPFPASPFLCTTLIRRPLWGGFFSPSGGDGIWASPVFLSPLTTILLMPRLTIEFHDRYRPHKKLDYPEYKMYVADATFPVTPVGQSARSVYPLI